MATANKTAAKIRTGRERKRRVSIITGSEEFSGRRCAGEKSRRAEEPERATYRQSARKIALAIFAWRWRNGAAAGSFAGFVSVGPDAGRGGEEAGGLAGDFSFLTLIAVQRGKFSWTRKSRIDRRTREVECRSALIFRR